MTIDVTWLTRMVGSGVGGAISTMGIRNVDLRGRQVRKKKLFEPVRHIHTPFPHSHPNLFYLPLFNSSAKRKLFLGRKNNGGTCPPCSCRRRLPNYTNVGGRRLLSLHA